MNHYDLPGIFWWCVLIALCIAFGWWACRDTTKHKHVGRGWCIECQRYYA